MQKFGTCLGLLLLLTAANTVQAQERKLGLKVSGNYINHYSQSGYRIGDLTPAVVYRDKTGNVHNADILSLNIQKRYQTVYDSAGNEAGELEHRDIDLGLRYQYNMALFGSDRALVPYIGFSGMFRFIKNEGQDVNSSRLTEDFRNFVFKPGINPGLMLVLKDKYLIDLSVPLEAELDWTRGLDGMAEPFKGFEFTQEYLKQLNLRLGVGLFL